ncbi:UNVERIFIED_CONTAM: La-related protein 6C [Sesamum angustifolium]|uniref:La-related protein 6C n=1 Tax=Sesamum angustifolium TaxID=2727405 RepID=A0AAW2NZJ5_9LAMI
MAQVSDRDIDATMENERDRNNNRSFKFNVAAPEFVPTLAHTTAAPVPITGYFYPCFQYIDGTSGNWIYVAEQDITLPLVHSKPNGKAGTDQTNNTQTKEIALSDELKQKIIKQAEYMFSDMSMLANETLVKHVNKDPEGYVPINFVSTLKKLKSLNVNNQMVAQALRSSTKLMRTVIAENLPDDHSHQKIEKMFNVVGSIRSIRICQPQDHNSSSRSSKGDVVISNKLHALVEYENAETAEKAAEKLNDERNWRKGMRVRLMLKRSANLQPKSVLKSRKSEFEVCLEDDGLSTHQSHEDASGRLSTSEATDSEENSAVLKRSWSRNRGKSKHRPQLQGARSLPTPSSNGGLSCPGLQPAKGPRMPDGTRGFTMGRGKPVAVSI